MKLFTFGFKDRICNDVTALSHGFTRMNVVVSRRPYIQGVYVLISVIIHSESMLKQVFFFLSPHSMTSASISAQSSLRRTLAESFTAGTCHLVASAACSSD